MKSLRWCLVVLLVASSPVSDAQVITMQSSPGHDAQHVVQSAGVPAATEDHVALKLALSQADPAKRGEVWLQVSAQSNAPAPAHVTLRIPLSSTEDVYGESRSCKVDPEGVPELTFTAGMDEDNFAPFAQESKQHELRLLLNKYLCRALAAPFHCGGRDVTLPADWSRWRLATLTSLVLTGDAPATLAATPVAVEQSAVAFDPATCAVIAPSNGMCCVAKKSTEWHCGGSPDGPGWHQVSGDCFHRETGGSCTDRTVFGPLQPTQ